METLLKTKMAGIEPRRGKVRDIYELGDKLLIVATDRLSAFDVVMKTGGLGLGANPNRDFPDGFSKTGCKKSVLTAQ